MARRKARRNKADLIRLYPISSIAIMHDTVSIANIRLIFEMNTCILYFQLFPARTYGDIRIDRIEILSIIYREIVPYKRDFARIQSGFILQGIDIFLGKYPERILTGGEIFNVIVFNFVKLKNAFYHTIF